MTNQHTSLIVGRSRELLALADRVAGGNGLDNALDVLIEVALFEPGEGCLSARANAAGTKVIYSYVDGTQKTHWAEEWTAIRSEAAASLRSAALRAQATNNTISEETTPTPHKERSE